MRKEITNAELMHITKSISELGKSDIKFPCNLLWNLKLNKNTLSNLMNVYTDCEKEILNEYSGDDKSKLVESEDGKSQRMVKPEFVQEFQGRMLELHSQKSEIEINTIPYELIEDLSFTSSEWDAIEFMVES